MRNKKNLSKFTKFLVGGFINFPLKIIITYLLTELLHMWYFASYIISLLTVITFSFFYNVYITFKVTHNKKNNFAKYCIVLGTFSIIDAISVKLLVDNIELNYMISIILITGILFIAKYLVYDKLVFKKNKNI